MTLGNLVIQRVLLLLLQLIVEAGGHPHPCDDCKNAQWWEIQQKCNSGWGSCPENWDQCCAGKTPFCTNDMNKYSKECNIKCNERGINNCPLPPISCSDSNENKEKCKFLSSFGTRLPSSASFAFRQCHTFVFNTAIWREWHQRGCNIPVQRQMLLYFEQRW